MPNLGIFDPSLFFPESAGGMPRWEDLANQQRRLDALIQVIDTDTYTPTLYQNDVAVAATVNAVAGLRLGPYVWLNVSLTATGTGTATSRIDISLPPQLPITYTGHRNPIGVFMVNDSSVGPNTVYTGYATPVSGGAKVFGFHDGTPFSMGVANPATALASGDEVGFSVHYLTTLNAF